MTFITVFTIVYLQLCCSCRKGNRRDAMNLMMNPFLSGVCHLLFIFQISQIFSRFVSSSISLCLSVLNSLHIPSINLSDLSSLSLVLSRWLCLSVFFFRSISASVFLCISFFFCLPFFCLCVWLFRSVFLSPSFLSIVFVCLFSSS